ncbi:MAG: ArdC family protein [Tepidisphaeraceae bacterium]
MCAANGKSRRSPRRDDPKCDAAATFDWSALLEEAVNTPGALSQAYGAFHSFSIGNQLLALFECLRRGLPIGPIATYNGWQKVGRQVRKGERAISLWMPLMIMPRGNTAPRPDDPGPDGAVISLRRIFVFRAHWFTLAQTDGESVQPRVLPDWSADRALAALGIAEEPFAHLDGNCQGYARGATIAVSPIAYAPDRTRLHEMAHVVLGHTSEGKASTAEPAAFVDRDERTPRDLREVEAEAVAYLCISALGLDGQACSRGYLQHWLRSVPRPAGEKAVPEKSVHRIFRAADQILKAGRPAADPAPADPE